jgi:hypothetical protein
MKTLLLVLVTVLLSACGSGGGGGSGSGGGSTPVSCVDSTYNGQWQILPGPTDILTLNSNCTGSMSRCGQTFGYQPPTATVGYVTITVYDAPNGQANCLAAGTYTCGVNYNATNMAINCGLGIVSYTKVP